MRRGLQQYLIFMGIKETLIIITASLFLQGCNCTKTGLGLDCAQTKYSFELGVKATPDKDSIAIGDTLWFEVNSPIQFKDAVTAQIIDYSKAENLGSGITFSALSSNSEFTVNSVDKFNYVLKDGIELRHGYSNGLGNEYQFIEKNNRYVFLLGIVAKEKGVYSIVFSNAGNVYRSNDKCTKASFNIIFENTNQHYPLNPFYIPGTNPRGGDYYFVVK
jgi:hypothetical protein